MINTKETKIIDKLIKKAEEQYNSKMPSLKSIHNLLLDLGIEHDFSETVNIVEYKSAGNRYVNNRHDGKKGFKIKEIEGKYFGMDTSSSYYSYNTWQYARKLINLLNKKGFTNNSNYGNYN